jgi:asparaginyl-tRNA synthetase
MVITQIKNIDISDIYNELTISGWIQQYRNQNDICFLCVNDGTNAMGLQVVYNKQDNTSDNIEKIMPELNNGCYVVVTGELIESPAKGQNFELKLTEINDYSKCDSTTYPLKKNVKLETLRQICHLRGRTKTFGCVYRIRNTIMYETHNYFQNMDYLHLDPNIITTNECEGGAGVFTVSELLTSEPNVQRLPRKKDNSLDYNKDHFKKQTFLTVSSQLQLEALACSIGNVYTMNKSFRSEHSNTNKHASEFTHLEIEVINIDNNTLMDIGINYVKHIINKVYEKNYDDITMLDKFVSKGVLKNIEYLRNCDFHKISYKEALEILHLNNFYVEYGDDLSSEMENFLTSYLEGPVAVYDWAHSIKSFYMKQSEIHEGVCNCFDLLMPNGVGELIGGSMREDNHEKLLNMMSEKGVCENGLEWYVDLRKYGTVPHGGFGLGIDRLIMLCTGMKNIRDVVPFPVNYQSCNY